MNDAKLRAAIAFLENEKRQIDLAIGALKALNQESNSDGVTVISAALSHLTKAGSNQTSAQLRKAIIAAGVTATRASIQTILSKRARQKKDLLHVGHGWWGLKK